MKYEQHPLSAAFPRMNDEDFQLLKDSIESIGVQNPITLHQGMIIDGWHRYTAAEEVGMDCPTVQLLDIDPKDFVLAQNKHRRHITVAQMAMAANAVFNWKNISTVPGTVRTDDLKEIAKSAGVSLSTIEKARQLTNTASQEVQDAVNSGEIGLKKALSISKLPEHEQHESIGKPLPKKEQAAVEPSGVDTVAFMDLSVKFLALQDAYDALEYENQDLRDRLAVHHMETTEEEKTKTLEIMGNLRKAVKSSTDTMNYYKADADIKMTEIAQLKNQCHMQQKQLNKLKGTSPI